MEYPIYGLRMMDGYYPGVEPEAIHDGKADQGKVDVDRFLRYFPRAIKAVSEVLEFGARKYEEGGWRNVPNGQTRYQAAGLRHKLARMSGEVEDPESGLPHQFHEVCNYLMALELLLSEPE